jgi:hypothetical protein
MHNYLQIKFVDSSVQLLYFSCVLIERRSSIIFLIFSEYPIRAHSLRNIKFGIQIHTISLNYLKLVYKYENNLNYKEVEQL